MCEDVIRYLRRVSVKWLLSEYFIVSAACAWIMVSKLFFGGFYEVANRSDRWTGILASA